MDEKKQMSDAEKRQMKMDIIRIMKTEQYLDYNNRAEVEKVSQAAMEKNTYSSIIGKRYLKQLTKISGGEETVYQCIFCRKTIEKTDVFCDDCRAKCQKIVSAASEKQMAATQAEPYPRPKLQAQEISQHAATSLKGGLDTFTDKINKMTGESGAVDLRLRDLFSNVFKKHSHEESEEIFSVGTSKTTPAESDIAVSWPKPWLFSRILLWLLAAFGLLYICVDAFQNVNAIPGLMFVGALAVPFAVLIFIFETNAPRNISIFEVVKMFFIGGGASLVFTLFLYEIFPVGQLNYIGAIIVGIVEEMGKILAISIFVKKYDSKYILNGMLIGAAIGAGFAVFETAGYAFRYYVSSSFDMEILTDILFLRGWTSVGTHVAWAAISGAGLVMVKGERRFTFKMLLNKKFIKFLFLSILLHAIWDCPFMSGGELVYIKCIVLIAVAWIILLVLLNAGLKQIERICASYYQSRSAPNPEEERQTMVAGEG